MTIVPHENHMSPEELQNSRRLELSSCLASIGLRFDAENEICQQYVYLGEAALYNNLPEIACLMAQTRFLNEYCNHDMGVKLARDQCANVRLPRDQWLQRVRRCVLQCAGYTDFPKTWPWLVPGHVHVGRSQTHCYFDDFEFKTSRKSHLVPQVRYRSVDKRSSHGAGWKNDVSYTRHRSSALAQQSWRSKGPSVARTASPSQKS